MTSYLFPLVSIVALALQYSIIIIRSLNLISIAFYLISFLLEAPSPLFKLKISDTLLLFLCLFIIHFHSFSNLINNFVLYPFPFDVLQYSFLFWVVIFWLLVWHYLVSRCCLLYTLEVVCTSAIRCYNQWRVILVIAIIRAMSATIKDEILLCKVYIYKGLVN